MLPYESCLIFFEVPLGHNILNKVKEPKEPPTLMVVQHYVNFWNGADVLDKQLIPWRREDEKNRFIFNRAAMTNLSFRHSFLLLKELLISLSEIAAAIKKKS